MVLYKSDPDYFIHGEIAVGLNTNGMLGAPVYDGSLRGRLTGAIAFGAMSGIADKVFNMFESKYSNSLNFLEEII